jgi:hypothetical protein
MSSIGRIYTDDLDPPHQIVGFPNITDGMKDARMLGDAASLRLLRDGGISLFR